MLDGSATTFLQFLKDAGITSWQVCPLGPTGYGDSPYQCFSAFAGNPYLIDLKELVALGLLTDADLAPLRALPADHVDFGWLYSTKWPALFRAYQRYLALPKSTKLPFGSFEEFKTKRRSWLRPFTLFLALKDHFGGKPWWEWPDDVRFYDRAEKSPIIQKPSINHNAEAHAFFQYLFFGQWSRVRGQARARGIEIIGDAPIFVALDGADVWSRPELFQLDRKTGRPLAVAGVPPDYFSADGQLWGNPLYAWEAHAKDGYAWWLERLRANFELCDIVRIDHFRGFDTYWSIPAGAPTAKTGTWEKGPGLAFFDAVKRALPDARLIAEDLGDLSDSVRVLRAQTGLPGMTILQFAFGGSSDNLYLPHNLQANSVVYPGTHDNDTTLGWYAAASEGERDHVRRYLRVNGREVGWDFIRAAYAATSNLAVIPMQDLFCLPSAARFNTPGKAQGNWQWRYRGDSLAGIHHYSAGYLRELGDLYGRLPRPTAKP